MFNEANDRSIQFFVEFSAAYGLFLIIFGTISNILTFITCLTKRLRSIPTFVFIACMSIMETIPLYIRILDSFQQVYLNFSLVHSNEAFCKIQGFVHFTTLHSSTWLLVAMTVERYLSVKIQNWRLTKFNSKKAAILSASIVTIFFVLNFCVNFAYDLVKVNESNNLTEFTTCYPKDWLYVWLEVNFFIYSLIPFILLVITNSLLIYITFKNSKNVANIARLRHSEAKRKSMTLTIIIMTIGFFIFTALPSISYAFYFKNLILSDIGGATLLFFVVFKFNLHSFNFIVLMIVNKKFASECKRLVCIAKRKTRIEIVNTRH